MIMSLNETTDLLYVKLADKSNSYGNELYDGLVISYDLDSDKITGFTLYDYTKKLYKISDIPEVSERAVRLFIGAFYPRVLDVLLGQHVAVE